MRRPWGSDRDPESPFSSGPLFSVLLTFGSFAGREVLAECRIPPDSLFPLWPLRPRQPVGLVARHGQVWLRPTGCPVSSVVKHPGRESHPAFGQAREHGEAPAGCRVPEADGIVVAAAGQPAFVWAYGHAPDGGLVASEVLPNCRSHRRRTVIGFPPMARSTPT
jgi:hypothetical protein